MSLTITIKGKGSIKSRVLAVKNAIRIAVTKALFEHGMYVMAKTLPITPLDRGDLRSSWFVHNDVSAQGPIVRIGFSVAYAERVHNMTNAEFQEPGTQAKFLSDTIDANRKLLERNLKSAVAKALGKRK